MKATWRWISVGLNKMWLLFDENGVISSRFSLSHRQEEKQRRAIVDQLGLQAI